MNLKKEKNEKKKKAGSKNNKNMEQSNKKLLCIKGHHTRVKRQSKQWKYIVNHLSDKNFISAIDTEAKLQENKWLD